MLKLISLELKQISLKPYIKTVIVTAIITTGLLYLFPILPHMESTDMDLTLFTSYSGIALLSSMLSMVIFTILSAVMSARFVIEDYCTKRSYLLFSYPVNRSKIFWSKICVITLFTVLSMLASGIVSLGIFFFTESLFPLCRDTLTVQTVLQALLCLSTYSVIAGALGVISLFTGFWKKSTPVAIVSGTIIAVVICQFGSVSMDTTGSFNIIATLIIACMSVVIAAILLTRLSQKIKIMEVE